MWPYIIEGCEAYTILRDGATFLNKFSSLVCVGGCIKFGNQVLAGYPHYANAGKVYIFIGLSVTRTVQKHGG